MVSAERGGHGRAERGPRGGRQWETDPALAGRSPESERFAAAWQAADKVVFSSTAAQVHTRRTRLERQLDARVVADLKAASDGDPTIGGPTLATTYDVIGHVQPRAAVRCGAMLGDRSP